MSYELLPPLLVAIGKMDHALDLQPPEEPVMRFAGLLFAEQAEEQEYIPHTHPLIGEMGLRCANLPEQAGATGQEHRVMMAGVVFAHPPLARQLGVRTKSKVAVGGA